MDRNKYTYIDLPSNACKKEFPSNTQGEYTIKLACPIDWSKYNVAFAEMQYPNTWLTLEDATMTIWKDDSEYKARFLDARYSEMDQLIAAITQMLANYHVQPHVTVHYDQYTMHTTVVIRAHNVKIQFGKLLASILGFPADTDICKGVHKSERASDLDNGMTALYVYLDILQNQMVGDSLVPLLRTVPLTGSRRFATVKAREVKHLQFRPTVGTVTDLVKVDIRRDTGEHIPFTTGKVLLTLALEKIS